VGKALMQREARVDTIMFVSTRPPEAIVEDELQRRGLNVKWANSIKGATHLLTSAPEGTATVTELALSDGNWRDLVQQVKGVSTSIPVVLVTPTSTAELWWDALDCEVEEVLTTPLSASRLCQVLGIDSKRG
jgi:DNA-binding NtrC family response regulator